MLKVRNVTKKFGKNTAVNKASFHVKAGEIFSLIGPNGSGKTTIVKVIAGLLQQTEGIIEIDGHDTLGDPSKTKAVTGYIPDDPSVWPMMTGEEFLHFTAGLYGTDARKREKQIKKLLSVFSLQGTEKNFFEDYSRGSKQKYTILAALMHKPKLLLIDEPIVGLDPTSAEIAKNKFQEFAKAGGAVLLVTHTLSVAQEIADRVGILKNGKLAAVGTCEELRNKAKLPADATLDEIYKALV